MIIDWPGVSIVIAHKNEGERFLQNLGLILKLDYPLFEIIIVDDNSNEENLKAIQNFTLEHAQIKVFQNSGQGKKAALLEGVNHASFDLILFTDADCEPSSDQWIRLMVKAGGRQGVVLGYGPYTKASGWLNTFVRFETVMTGIQYISAALHGRPYMSVGRNILYPRHVFFEAMKGNSFLDVPYGDDDLTIQSLPPSVQYFVCYEEKAHVFSESAETWPALWKQKHRHMSAGHHYSFQHWWRPGIFGIALIFHWILLMVLFFCFPAMRFLPVFIIGLGIRWLCYGLWAASLGDLDTVKFYPLLELQYAFYLGAMGMYTMMNKKKTWN